MSEQLIDPTSPLFRRVIQCSADDRVWSGEVNGKNRFGAYVGYEPFFYAPDGFALGYDDYQFAGMLRRCYGSETATEDDLLDAGLIADPEPTPTPTATPEAVDSEAANDADLRSEGFDPDPCEGEDYAC